MFWNIAVFPTVLRSDNAYEFVINEIFLEIKKRLVIRHAMGSVYHPQSQGRFERMHRSWNDHMRELIANHPGDWEARLPDAVIV